MTIKKQLLVAIMFTACGCLAQGEKEKSVAKKELVPEIIAGEEIQNKTTPTSGEIPQNVTFRVKRPNFPEKSSSENVMQESRSIESKSKEKAHELKSQPKK